MSLAIYKRYNGMLTNGLLPRKKWHWLKHIQSVFKVYVKLFTAFVGKVVVVVRLVVVGFGVVVVVVVVGFGVVGFCVVGLVVGLAVVVVVVVVVVVWSVHSHDRAGQVPSGQLSLHH